MSDQVDLVRDAIDHLHDEGMTSMAIAVQKLLTTALGAAWLEEKQN